MDRRVAGAGPFLGVAVRLDLDLERRLLDLERRLFDLERRLLDFELERLWDLGKNCLGNCCTRLRTALTTSYWRI